MTPRVEENDESWAYLVCERFPSVTDADTVECGSCHDEDHPIEPDQYWILQEPEIGDSCYHCGARIVAADEDDQQGEGER